MDSNVHRGILHIIKGLTRHAGKHPRHPKKCTVSIVFGQSSEIYTNTGAPTEGLKLCRAGLPVYDYIEDISRLNAYADEHTLPYVQECEDCPHMCSGDDTVACKRLTVDYEAHKDERHNQYWPKSEMLVKFLTHLNSELMQHKLLFLTPNVLKWYLEKYYTKLPIPLQNAVDSVYGKDFTEVFGTLRFGNTDRELVEKRKIITRLIIMHKDAQVIYAEQMGIKS